MRPAIPVVKVSHHLDTLCIGCPKRKIDPLLITDAPRMGTEFFVELPMVTGTEEVAIEIAQPKLNTMGIDLVGHVARGSSLGLQLGFIASLDNFRVLDQDTGANAWRRLGLYRLEARASISRNQAIESTARAAGSRAQMVLGRTRSGNPNRMRHEPLGWDRLVDPPVDRPTRRKGPLTHASRCSWSSLLRTARID